MNVGRYLRGEDRHVGTARTTQPQPPQRTEQCNYPDCKCPTENPCLKGLAQPEQEHPVYSPFISCELWRLSK